MLHLLRDEYRGRIEGLRVGGTMCDFGEMKCQTMNGHNMDQRLQSVSDHETHVPQLQADVVANQANITTNQTNITTTQASVSSNSASIAAHTTDIATNLSNISVNQGSITTNSSSIASQNTNITQLQTDVSANTSSISSTQSNVDTNSTSIASQNMTITQLQTDVSTNTSSLSSKLNSVAQTDLNMNDNNINGINGLVVEGQMAAVGTLHWEQLRLMHPNSSVSKWDIGAQWHTPNTYDNDLYFTVTYSDGAQHNAGFIQDDVTTIQMNATIQHRCFYNGTFDDSMVGKILVSTGRYMNLLKAGETCSQQRCITINDSIPIVEICNSPASNAVFGVVSDKEEDKRTWAAGNFVSTYDKVQGDNRLIVNGGGEGAIWICNSGGNLAIGDLIESFADGYGRKQADNIIRSSTVARITMACNFNPTNEPVKIYRGFDEKTNTIIWEYPTDDQGNPVTEPAYNCETRNIGGVNRSVAFVGCVYLAS